MKTVIKDICIILLICLAILIVLSILLYNYIPSNKVLPAEAKYNASEETKKQISEAVESEGTEIILKYEVTASDLKNYERTGDYKAGKVNPFGLNTDKTTGSSDTKTSTSTGTGTSTSTSTGSQKSDSSSSTTGTYFETKKGTK